MSKESRNKLTIEKNGKLVQCDKKFLEELGEAFEDVRECIDIPPTPMVREFLKNNDSRKLFDLQLSKWGLIFGDEKKQDAITNRILGEILTGAYQDRIVAYSVTPTRENENSSDAIEMIQRIRQKADMHLIRIMQFSKDIRRPPVNVIVKQAEQVNVGEKQMNIEKQLNIASDLDKKNEKID